MVYLRRNWGCSAPPSPLSESSACLSLETSKFAKGLANEHQLDDITGVVQSQSGLLYGLCTLSLDVSKHKKRDSFSMLFYMHLEEFQSRPYGFLTSFFGWSNYVISVGGQAGDPPLKLFFFSSLLMGEVRAYVM